MTSKLDEELGRLLNAPMEFKYIEDPEIVALLREMATRWPQLAAAADHPLLEFFFHRQGRLGVVAPLLGQMRKVLLLFLVMLPFLLQPFIGILTTITMQYNGILVWTIIFSVAFGFPELIFFLIRRKRYARFARTPENLILNDREKNCWIWLTGITPAELSAIVFAYHYRATKGLARIRPALYLIWLAIAAILIRYFANAGAQTRSIMIVIEVFPFVILYTYHLTDHSLIAQQALWRLELLLSKRNRFQDYGSNNAMLILAFVSAQFFVSSHFVRIPIIALVLFGIFKLHQRLGAQVAETFKEVANSEKEFAKVLVPEQAEA
ncbi:hypothetical protein LLG95_16350 [bacterium]|nr:hypothetical protein [bacterium]